MRLYANGTDPDGNPAYLKKDVQAFGKYIAEQLQSGAAKPEELAAKYSGAGYSDGQLYLGTGVHPNGRYFELTVSLVGTKWKVAL